MKNFFILITMLFVAELYAQENQEVKLLKNEISFNFFDMAFANAYELQYERYFRGNQALQINFVISDNYGYYSLEKILDNKSKSISVAYRSYFNYEPDGAFVYVYAKKSFGEILMKDIEYYSSENSQHYRGNFDLNMNNFSLGVGAGYKFLIMKRYTLAIDGSIGTNLAKNINVNNLPYLDYKFGLSAGYRF